MGLKQDCLKLVHETQKQLGGVDHIISNAGWTMFFDWQDTSFPESGWDKTYAVNVKAHVHLLEAVLPIFKGNAEGGSLQITGSIAAITSTGSSLAYSVSKAAQVHLIKGIAKSYGPKLRCNGVLPGLLLTEWVFGGLKLEVCLADFYREITIHHSRSRLQ